MRIEHQVTKAPVLLLGGGGGGMVTADTAQTEPCLMRGLQQESSLSCLSIYSFSEVLTPDGAQAEIVNLRTKRKQAYRVHLYCVVFLINISCR